MSTKEKNSYMILYVLLDFIRYLRTLESHAQSTEEQQRIHQQCDTLQLYCGLYLKQTLGEKEATLFLQELSRIL